MSSMRRAISTGAILLVWGGAAGGAAAQGPAVAIDPDRALALPVAERFPQDPADSLYQAAREALDRDQYERAAELFRRVRERYPDSSYAARSLYWEAFALYREGGDDELREALEALRLQRERYGREATRGDAEALRTRIRGELARRGDAEAAEEVTEVAKGDGASGAQGPEACGEDHETRIAALNALLQMSSERALPILEKVLAARDGCSVELREKAVFLVAQHVSGENLGILLDVARNDPSLDVREKAVFWLSQVSGPEAVNALEDILRRSQERRLQERALFALSQHQGERASRILREFAAQEDAPAELREKAVFWIGQHDSPENARLLRELFNSTDAAKLKEKIVFSLAQMGREENRRWMLELAVDGDQPLSLRKKAIFWAGQTGMRVEELARLYERMPERELKEQLIFALGQRDEPAAVDVLMDIARSGETPELRKKAIFWLGQSSDPRVEEFLLELIQG